MDRFQLTGRIDSHIKFDRSHSLAAETDTFQAFSKMKQEAAKAGIELKAYSAFRNFNSQLEIWNRKFAGDRPLYNQAGNRLDYHSLSEEERVHAILTWSALPGASRHHWGTDIDVIDTAPLPDNYQVQLLPQEFAEGGVFFPLQNWLQENMANFGFFKPYRMFKGGVSAEPWHISYAPVSKELLAELTLEMVMEAITERELLGKDIVQKILPNIFKTYVLNICE